MRSEPAAHSILTIPVKAGAEDEFAHGFNALRVFEHAGRIAGFRGGRLLRPLAPGEPFVVVAEWDAPEGYQAWLDSPVREELARAMSVLVEGEMTGALFVDATEEGRA